MLHENFCEFLGMIAAACTIASFVPQMVLVLKTKSTKSLSLGMYVTTCIGLVLWVIYGWLLRSWALIIANVMTFILAFIILCAKVRWRHQ